MALLPTATSIDERRRTAKVAVLPIESFEQHGTQPPLATDTVVACSIAERIATAYELFLLPPVTISCSHEHSAWWIGIPSTRRIVEAWANSPGTSAQSGTGKYPGHRWATFRTEIESPMSWPTRSPR